MGAGQYGSNPSIVVVSINFSKKLSIVVTKSYLLMVVTQNKRMILVLIDNSFTHIPTKHKGSHSPEDITLEAS